MKRTAVVVGIAAALFVAPAVANAASAPQVASQVRSQVVESQIVKQQVAKQQVAKQQVAKQQVAKQQVVRQVVRPGLVRSQVRSQRASALVIFRLRL